MTGKKQNVAPMWKKLMKNIDLHEPISFLDHVYQGFTQRECRPNEIVIEKHKEMFESRISAGATEKLPGWAKPHAKTHKNVWKGIAHWRTKRQSNCAKFQVVVWKIIRQRKKSLNQLRNDLKYAYKLP